MSAKKSSPGRERGRLEPEQLRWRCDPDRFGFETTDTLDPCPINIIGQPRALEALELGLSNRADGYNIFICGPVGSGRSTVVRRTLAALDPDGEPPPDIVFVYNFGDPDRPCRLNFRGGRGRVFRTLMEELHDSLARDLPKLFESEDYRHRRAAQVETTAAAQKLLLKEFEKRVQERGFTLAQVQMGPFVRSQLVPLVAGNPVEMDQLEALVEQGQFKPDEYDRIRETYGTLKTELEGLSKQVRDLDRALRRTLRELGRETARPLVEEAVGEIRESFRPENLGEYLDGLVEDVLEHLEDFRDGDEGESEESTEGRKERRDHSRHAVNVVVDNSQTKGRPVIWEKTPSYRNLFGTVDKTRTESGEWATDHTRIKAGSLLRANGGFLVIDALDLLVEPGVWSALKRTLRHRQVDIQAFDPVLLVTGVSLAPEPVPIDVKVLVIGTHQIYRLLYAVDEDFKKIFKVKAEFARQTPLNDDELMNYACLIRKRCNDDALPPYHKGAVAAIVEHGVRLAGSRGKLTTRFGEVTDIIREAGYWAKKAGSANVEAGHVDEALRHRVYRVDLIEEILRDRIVEGDVLIDLSGERVAQVNGLAVLSVGDHEFGLPSRITATTAMGRVGIIDIDREAEMSGAIHTKGVLILTGFLRSRFAQARPLTLTASLTFEQSYGGIDGDSASCAELYAVLSSLSGVPIRQGISVTGSVNQFGEVQPIGGVNEKIEGYFDLCRMRGLDGEQGVMIPTRNLPHLMLRRDVADEVRAGRFQVWAVATIEEGLEVLTGKPAGARAKDGSYPARSVLGRAGARLAELAEALPRFGPADAHAD
jgi:lon-related putative ATP-dependent protease